MVMEYMQDMQDGSFKNHKPMEMKNCINFTRQLLDGLLYLHQNGYVYRDIKCDNLLLTGNGWLKLGDLGLTVRKSFRDPRNPTFYLDEGRHMGSFRFMAPEVLRDTRAFSNESDIWSVGCTMVEMRTDFPP